MADPVCAYCITQLMKLGKKELHELARTTKNEPIVMAGRSLLAAVCAASLWTVSGFTGTRLASSGSRFCAPQPGPCTLPPVRTAAPLASRHAVGLLAVMALFSHVLRVRNVCSCWLMRACPSSVLRRGRQAWGPARKIASAESRREASESESFYLLTMTADTGCAPHALAHALSLAHARTHTHTKAHAHAHAHAHATHIMRDCH